ncbi:MAG: hypothetical protein KKB94_05745, partial [Proteobacteria bacterium]|nr:hypothetical protein [Pseudomonadota bacterium]
GSLSRTVEGPHGLHNVNDTRWADGGHEDFYENDEAHCKACHGTALTGTVLSRTAAARSFEVEDEPVSFTKGEAVSCDKCHDMP